MTVFTTCSYGSYDCAYDMLIHGHPLMSTHAQCYAIRICHTFDSHHDAADDDDDDDDDDGVPLEPNLDNVVH